MMDGISIGLINLTPSVRHGTVRFIEKLTRNTPIDLLNQITSDLMPILVKLIKDKDQGIRDATLHCIGILKGKIGDDQMSQYLENIEPIKMAKIDDASKEISDQKNDSTTIQDITQ
jgi:hypothetical protein